jgi:hypothetical protein
MERWRQQRKERKGSRRRQKKNMKKEGVKDKSNGEVKGEEE